MPNTEGCSKTQQGRVREHMTLLDLILEKTFEFYIKKISLLPI